MEPAVVGVCFGRTGDEEEGMLKSRDELVGHFGALEVVQLLVLVEGESDRGLGNA